MTCTDGFSQPLDAQREEYGLQDQVVTAKQSVAIQFIVVYKALGGGWELYELLPPPPRPQPAILATFRRLSQPGSRSGFHFRPRHADKAMGLLAETPPCSRPQNPSELTLFRERSAALCRLWRLQRRLSNNSNP